MSAAGAEAKREHVSPTDLQRWALGGGLLIGGVLLIATLIGVWPAATTSAKGEHAVALVFGLFKPKMSVDEALLLLIVVAGGLGAMVNTATEFAYRAGDDRLDRSYLWWYPMRFVIAAATALIFYFVVRGGLFDPTPSASTDVNVYVFAALASLAGLFSTQAVRLLGGIFGALPGLSAPYAEAAPKVTGLVRGEADTKARPGELVLRGHGFKPGARVLVEGRPASARLIDDTRIGVDLGQHHQPGARLNVVVRAADDVDAEHASSEPTTVVVPAADA